MEQCTQITLAQWNQWKNDIREKLEETAENFVYIGYRLKQISETEAYRTDGYEDLYAFAEAEYGLSKSTVSRFIAINNKFSIDGNSPELKREAKGLGFSKLSEMLTLSDADCQLITQKTTVKEIRELKQFNHGTPEEKDLRQQDYTPLQKCIIDFFSDPARHNLLNEIVNKVAEQDFGAVEAEQICEELNPSGCQSHKKGIVYLFLYDFQTGVKYKLMTKPQPIEMPWTEFISEIFRIYAPYIDGESSIWCNFYGPLPEEPDKTQIPGQMSLTDTPKKEKSVPEQEETGLQQNATSQQEETSKILREEPSESMQEQEEAEETDAFIESDTSEETADISVHGVSNETAMEEDSMAAGMEPGNIEEYGMPAPEQNRDILDNPEIRLRDEAEELAAKIYENIRIHAAIIEMPTDELWKVKENLDKLQAVVQQIFTLRRLSDGEEHTA